MKIVYTYYLLTCVALCSIFSSCNNETDIYMENPDKRIQTKMQEYTDILTGAPDGWIAEINTQLIVNGADKPFFLTVCCESSSLGTQM